MIGELDNWTPSAPCSDLVNKLSSKTNISLTIYKDSHHSFDRDAPVIRDENAYNFSDCIFRLDKSPKPTTNFIQLFGSKINKNIINLNQSKTLDFCKVKLKNLLNH